MNSSYKSALHMRIPVENSCFPRKLRHSDLATMFIPGDGLERRGFGPDKN